MSSNDLETGRPRRHLDIIGGKEGVHVDTQQGGGGTVIQTNQISTPVLLACLAVLILSIAISCVAVGYAMQAEREAQNAEREARVALNHSEETKVQTEVNKTLIETFVIKGKQP